MSTYGDRSGAGVRVLLALDRLIPELVLLQICLVDLFVFDFVKKIAVEKKTMAWRLCFTSDDNEPLNHATELGFLGFLTKAIIGPDDIR